jgi:hypothetical protein
MAKMVDSPSTEARLRWAEALPLVALGMIAGVSFLAQPAKFLTPGLNLSQLVSVGSTIFDVSHAVQWGWLLLLAVVVPPAKDNRALAWALLAAFGLTLSLQQFGLMPPLEARLVELRQGLQPAPSLLHAGYAGLEALKLAALFVLSALRRAASRFQSDMHSPQAAR